MDTEALFQRLKNSRDTFPELLKNTMDKEMRWKPPSGNWSLLEIIGHLGHEEVNDFRARLAATLEDPTQPWRPIDPETTVVELAFNQMKVNDLIESFVSERDHSLRWLRGILDAGDAHWEATYHHPTLGPVRAGDLFASWVAHDQLHIRQIAKRIYELTARDAGDYGLVYAGEL